MAAPVRNILDRTSYITFSLILVSAYGFLYFRFPPKNQYALS